jgi:hypothetical protein
VAGVEVEVLGDVLDAVAATVKALAQTVTIGVHADAAPYPDGTSVVEVARAQEFVIAGGRPFVRGYFDSGGARELGDVAAEVIFDVVAGKATSGTVGKKIGETGVEGVRGYVEAGTNLTPLAQMTRDNPDRDQRMIPLLDTGHLIGQIAVKVKAG